MHKYIQEQITHLYKTTVNQLNHILMISVVIDTLEEGQFVIIHTKTFNPGRKDESKKIYTGIISYTSDKHIGFSRASIIHNYTNGKQYGGESIVNSFSVDREIILNIFI